MKDMCLVVSIVLLASFAEIKPTTIPMVPRLLNKFYPVFKGIYEK